MGLQNKESSYIQAVSNRWDIALPQNMASVTPSATAFEESALYIDAHCTLSELIKLGMPAIFAWRIMPAMERSSKFNKKGAP